MDLVKQVLVDEFGEDIKRYANEVSQLYGNLSSNNGGGGSPTSSANLNQTPKDSIDVKPGSLFKYNTITESIAISLFELYTAVNSIYKFRHYLNENDRGNLKINSFYELFYMPYKRWIDLIKRKIDAKVEKCFENEKVRGDFFSRIISNLENGNYDTIKVKTQIPFIKL